MTAADWTELAALMQTRADLELAVGDTRLAQGYRRRRDYAARKARERMAPDDAAVVATHDLAGTP